MVAPESLRAATDGFVEIEGLKALAVRLAAEIDGCYDVKVMSQLARQYRETMGRIATIEGGVDEDDEITAIILRNRKPTSDNNGGASE